MRQSRRKVLIRIIEGTALAVVLLDVALYLAVVRPLGKALAAEEQRLAASGRRLTEADLRVTRLEKYQAALPDVDTQVKVFLRDHVPPRRRGFSQAARLVRLLTQASNLELSNIAYKLDSAREEPLQRLEIEMSVTGPFPDLLSFAHAFDTASDFVLVREFVFDPADQGRLGLRLRADLYLQP